MSIVSPAILVLNLLAYSLSMLLNLYISNELIKSIEKSIYLKLSINIPQPRVLGHVFFFFYTEVN